MNSEIVAGDGGAGNLSVAAFYGGILPPQGLKCLVVFKTGMKNAPTHTYYQDNDDLIEAAETWSKLGKNSYHGCATFKDSKARTQVNVAAVKSLWIDLDVGADKPYKTLRESVVSAVGFAVKLGLSKPHLVRSGGGLHVYFAFTTAISGENWDKLAAAFQACLDHAGVQHDSSRTTDSASILRVPGTQNYKEATPRLVVLTQLGDEESAQSIYKKLKAYADTHGVILLSGKVKVKGPISQANADLIGVRVYPPAYGEKAARNCPVLAEVAQTGGDVPYEIWWRAMGVTKFLQDADVTAAHWTRNRAATGHSQTDWQKAMNGWAAAGPTTCAGFAKHSSKCKTCPRQGVAG